MSAENSNNNSAGHVLKTPVWMVVIRAFQFLISIIIIGLAGRLMHDAYLDEEGLALAISLITWIVIAYVLLTEKISSFHKAYNVIAVLTLDGFLVIMWLASFAAVAAERARYVFDVDVDSCYSDGSLVDSKFCFKKRSVILFETGADMLSAIAGLGALVWLLFIATFAWGMTMFFRGRKEGRFMFGAKSNDHQMENQQRIASSQHGAQGEKIATQSQQQQPVQQLATGQYQMPPAAQYPPQGQYSQVGYQPPVSPQPTSPGQYQTPYAPPRELYTQPQQAELYGQTQQQYGQYPPQQGYQAQQPLYPQHTGSAQSPHSELDGQGQHYSTPSPPTASPPLHHQ